ncbi:pyridoxamine 5'-phosphate oxidase family protein [bacterium]
MNDTDKSKYLPLRKEKHRITEDEAWAILVSPDIPFGFLGTHGVKEEGNMPYVVPMNFAAERDSGAIYLHTTLDEDSKRNRSVAESPDICFTAVHPDSKIIPSDEGLACKFSMNFKSVIAMGTAEKIEDATEKTRILNHFMDQKAASWPHREVGEHMTFIATIYRINVAHITGALKE